jgi:hypothetical protein
MGGKMRGGWIGSTVVGKGKAVMGYKRVFWKLKVFRGIPRCRTPGLRDHPRHAGHLDRSLILWNTEKTVKKSQWERGKSSFSSLGDFRIEYAIVNAGITPGFFVLMSHMMPGKWSVPASILFLIPQSVKR